MERSKRAERRTRRAIFGILLGRAGDRDARRDAGLDLRAVRRVLVVRANFRMGNLLLTTPALAALRAALPHARVDVLGPDVYLDLLWHHPAVDRAIGVDRRTLLEPWSLLTLVERLRRERYDLAIDAARGSSFLGALLTRLSGSRHRVAVAGCRYARFFDVRVPRRPELVHKVDLLLGVLEGLGIPAVTREPSIVVTPDERHRAAIRWRDVDLHGMPIVGLHVGGRGAKALAPRWIADLARALRAGGDVQVVLLAGSEDAARLTEIRAYLPADVAVAPRGEIRELAALLSRCAVVVSGDTGPLHLAAAVGAPTVGLFVAPQSRFYAPRGDRHRVLTARELSASTAADAVRAVIAPPPASHPAEPRFA